MRYFILFFLLCGVGRQGLAQETYAQYRTKYTFEREKYTGNTKSTPQKTTLPFDTLAQKADFTATLNKTLDYVPPIIHVVKPIEKKKFEGFRIQIYRGRNREDAINAKKIAYEMYPNLNAYMEYSAPTYRVKVGDFLEQSEYSTILRRLKRSFPTAISVRAIVTIIIDNRDELEEREKRRREKEKNKENKENKTEPKDEKE